MVKETEQQKEQKHLDDVLGLIKKKEKEYIELLNTIAKNNEYTLVCFLVTDIINNGSYIYFNEEAEETLKKCFDKEEFKQGIYMENIVSRKKQVIPAIVNYLEKN